jgi:Ca2+-binding RTX toxin-like protein
MRSILLAVALLALHAAPAVAGPGTITITGTEGRDDVRVVAVGDWGTSGQSTVKSGDGYMITPAVTVVGPVDGSGAPRCQPVNERLTGRAIGVFCPGTNGQDFVVDLRGGNDAFFLNAREAPVISTLVNGAAGNDTISVTVLGAKRLQGGDGDDALGAPTLGTTGVTFEGGAGRDLVDYANTEGVTASLASGRATVFLRGQIDATTGSTVIPDQTRADVLNAVERLSGSPAGDSLTGGTGPDELIGLDGGDVLDGGAGADILSGGNGSDRLTGGADNDTLDGGDGFDEFPAATGRDTYNARDGIIERIACVSADVAVVDLADVVVDPSRCSSVSVAAAKHLFDTRVQARTLGRTGIALRCPKDKPERCEGRLRLRAGGPTGRVVASADYRIRPGRKRRLRMPLGANARRTLTAELVEVDDDARPRQVLRRLPAP